MKKLEMKKLKTELDDVRFIVVFAFPQNALDAYD